MGSCLPPPIRPIALLLVLLGHTLAAPVAALEVIQVVTDGVNEVDGLAGVRHIAVSPDERHLYAAGNDESAVAVFAIGARGQLTFVQALKDDEVGGSGDGLDTARHLAVSPDGENLYVAAYNEFAMGAFARDPLSGALSFLAEVPNPPCCGVFTSINEVAVSPDGGDVYTVSNGYAAALARGLGGALSLTDSYNVAADSFGRGFALAVSPDGAHVYIGRDTSLEVTARDAGGALSFVTGYTDGLGGVDGLAGIEAIAISPDGADLYVGTYNGDRAIAHFWRDPGSGLLTYQQLYADTTACPNPNELLFADAGTALVASCLTTVAFYGRDPNTGALQLLLSIPQEDLGASEIYSSAVSQGAEAIYIASYNTDSIIVVPEPGGAALAALLALGCATWRRRTA